MLKTKNGFSTSGIIITIALIVIVAGGIYLGLENKPSVNEEAESPSASEETPTIAIGEPNGGVTSDDSMTGDDMAPPNTGAPTPAPAPAPTPIVEEGVKVFNIDARNYSYSRSEIRVKRGDKVRIVLGVTEGMHDWVVDEFHAKTARISAGQTTTIEFVPDQSGVFEFYCSVGDHRKFGMVGNLVVI